jgi:hypothetical protein
VLPTFGWHMVWWLRSLAGLNGATALVGLVLVVIFAVILVTLPGARPFVVTALVIGFIFPVLGITVTAHLARATMFPAEQPGNRYTVLPIYLFISAAIVAVDYVLRRRAAQPGPVQGPAQGPARGAGSVRLAMAVTALVAVLAFSWVVDFQYVGWRSNWGWTWAPIAAKWQHDCAVSKTGQITEKAGAIFQMLPCDRIRS